MGADYKRQKVSPFLFRPDVQIAANSTRYFTYGIDSGVFAIPCIPLPYDCEISYLHAYKQIAPGVGESLQFTVFAPGATPITCTIDGAVETQDDDLVNAVIAQRGDLIAIQVISSLNCQVSFASASILLRRI